MIGRIKRQSLLYKSKVEYADYSVNHVQGCAHGCKYPCYAMQMARFFGRVKDYDEWVKPKLVTGAVKLLDEEIRREKGKIKTVHLCFMTDPFMYGYPEVQRLSLAILRKLNQHGVPASVLTKGIYPPVLESGRYNKDNIYGITLVSLDEGFRRRYEPFAAPLIDRINALYELHSKGLKTWVSMEPYPTPNMVQQDVGKILEELSFVDRIVFGKLNYNGSERVARYIGFYGEESRTVVDFCVAHGIEYHIKSGTPIKGVDPGERPVKKPRRKRRKAQFQEQLQFKPNTLNKSEKPWPK
jgi:DNA repair photolyase